MGLELLGANQPPERFYRGGAEIDRFRGVALGPDRRPEDWVGSTTTLAGEARTGLSRLRSGELLVDAIAADPDAWLGPPHVEAFGTSSMLLVKLLDAGQRLPVHAHPDDAFSRAHLHRPFGKAEAWYILEGGTVHLGLREPVDRERLAQLVSHQGTAELVGLLHVREVVPGDVVYVPPGELHAIGAGVFLLEVQQPEDLSILLEWEGFALDGEREGHLGVGFELALQAVTTDRRTAADLDRWIFAAGEGESVLPSDSASFFRLGRHVVEGRIAIEPGFAILVVEHGELELTTASGNALTAARGSTIVCPHAEGVVTVAGEGTILVCRPPSPEATLRA
jgi:mannose-6-phosphate isomerase